MPYFNIFLLIMILNILNIAINDTKKPHRSAMELFYVIMTDLFVTHFQNLVFHHATWCLNLDFVAFVFANQTFGNGAAY